MKRRTFLKVSGATATIPLLDQVLASSKDAVDPIALRMSPEREFLKVGACDMCGAQDPLFLRVVDGRVVGTFANAGSSYSGGKICGKAHAAVEKAYHPHRITRPMMRRGPGHYEPVSWDTAIAFMSDRLARIAKKYGENAVHVYMGLSSQPAIWKSFWKTTFGTKNVFGNDSVCDAGRRTACALTLGDSRPLPDLLHTKVGLVLGADYLASTKYLWYPTQMLQAMKAGARFYVVDPRLSETAARAVEFGGTWVPIKPGTDAAFAMAIANVIFDNPGKYATRVNADLIQWDQGTGWSDGRYGLGVDRFAAAVKDKTPKWASTITGISEELIREIADDLMLSDAPMVDAWTGLSHQANGVYAVRAAMCLAGLVNAIDRKGGLVRQHTAKLGKAGCRAVPGAAYRTIGHPKKLADACGMYRFVRSDVNGFVPQAMLDATFAFQEYKRRRSGATPTPFEYPVKGFITSTRNFANGNSDSALWRKALTHLLDDPDGLVVDVNLFISEQGAHAHLVLPEAAYFERDDLMKPSSLYPTLHVRRAVVPPAGESKTMLAITRLLANGLAKAGFKGGRFSVDDVVPYRHYEDVMRELVNVDQPGGERIDFSQLLEMGFWQSSSPVPRYRSGGFGWSKLGKFTESFDFYCPALAGEQPPNNRLHPAAQGGSAAQAYGSFDLPPPGTFDPLPVQKTTAYLSATKEFPLRLVGCGRHQWSSASKTSHLASSVEKEPTNHMVMHPDDARPRGIYQGDSVSVRSKHGGAIRIRVHLSQGIRPGCVHISNGYGQHRAVEPTARGRGANVNELTDANNLDPVSGAEGIAEMLVQVEGKR